MTIISKPSSILAECTITGNVWEPKSISEVPEEKSSSFDRLLKKLSLFPKDFKQALQEMESLCEESISYSMIFIEKGLFGTKEASPKTSIIRFLTTFTPSDEDLIKPAYVLIEKTMKHGWQVGDKLVECGLFKKIFNWMNEWVKLISSPSQYNNIQEWQIKEISSIFNNFVCRLITCNRSLVIDGGLLFLFNMIRIHSSSCIEKYSLYQELSTDILINLSFRLMWRLYCSFLNAEKGYEKTVQSISSSVGGNDLLLDHYNKSHKEGTATTYKVERTGIYYAIILSLIHAHTNIPLKYQTILGPLKSEIEVLVNSDLRSVAVFSISLLATTPTNRALLYQKGFHLVIFDVLVKEGVESLLKLLSSQALCNMTCEVICKESAKLKNTMLNAERLGKLESMMDRIIYSSPESIASKSNAERNAVVVENILLLLSNMLVENIEVLTPIFNSGFISHTLNHLSPDDDDKNRQNAGNIKNQQKAALRVLHSITFHQTAHIKTLVEIFNVLACVNVVMDGKDDEIMELVMSGVLYNISVKGNEVEQACEGEVNKNDFLAEYEEVERLVETISNTAKSSYKIKTKQYAALTLGQLYRNKPLKDGYKHIIFTLKNLMKGNDKDMSFKATNTLQMLDENDDNVDAFGSFSSTQEKITHS